MARINQVALKASDLPGRDHLGFKTRMPGSRPGTTIEKD
jgi:hypothetical protein